MRYNAFLVQNTSGKHDQSERDSIDKECMQLAFLFTKDTL